MPATRRSGMRSTAGNSRFRSALTVRRGSGPRTSAAALADLGTSLWTDVAPQGTLYSWTRTHYVTAAIKERALDLPFVVVLVELPGAGGIRIDGVLAGSEEGLRIGALVYGVIAPASEKSKGYTSMTWALGAQ